MIVTREIHYGRTLKLPQKVQYAQDGPMFNEKITMTFSNVPADKIEDECTKAYEMLKKKIDDRCSAAWEAFEASRKKDTTGLRIREKDGIMYPSVTSILNPNGLPDGISPEYAIRGEEVEEVFVHFLTSGEWVDYTRKLEKLSYDDVCPKKFWETHKDRIDVSLYKPKYEVFHKKMRYSGEVDFNVGVDAIETLTDVKTGQYDMAQLVSYNESLSKPLPQIAVFDMKNNKIDVLKRDDPKYILKAMTFGAKRNAFKEVYGL